MLLRATLRHADRPGRLEVWTTADFRESVLFTPPHRQAVCIEPYTCLAGAFGLAERNLDTGLRVLPPGHSFEARVEFRVV